MSRNPFEPSRPSSSSLFRPDLARVVSGPGTARVMKQLLCREGKRVRVAKSSAQLDITPEELRAEAASHVFESLRVSEAQRLYAFFGEAFAIPSLPKEITPELKEFWEQNGFKLEYWPKVRMSEEKDFPGWEHKPGKRYCGYGMEFFDHVHDIQNLPANRSNPHLKELSPLDLPGCWVLKDTRVRPNFDDGNQVYENDSFIQEVLGSRFERHPCDFDEPDFWVPLIKALRLDLIPGVSIRLPRIIEANVMGQVENQETDTCEWCEEYWQSGERAIWGSANFGGASFVSWTDEPSQVDGFRPLIIFAR